MKNFDVSVKERIISRYRNTNKQKAQSKCSDINVLLNRIELNKKNENRKKIYFSAAASTGLILFGFLIF